MRNYSRNPREWMVFFGWWLVLMVVWIMALGFMGFVTKIMWRIFMMGWNLV